MYNLQRLDTALSVKAPQNGFCKARHLWGAMWINSHARPLLCDERPTVTPCILDIGGFCALHRRGLCYGGSL